MFIGHSIGDADGTILAMDAAVADALERGRTQVAGKSYLELTHPDDRLRNATMIDRLNSDALPIVLRKRYVTPDGVTVEMDVHVSRLSTGSDAGRLVGTLYRPEQVDTRFAPEMLWRAARQLAYLNTVRRDLLGGELFADYAVSILLQVYLDEAEGRGSEVAVIAALIGLNTDSALRWMRALKARRLIEMDDDGAMVQLSATGARTVAKLLTASERH